MRVLLPLVLLVGLATGLLGANTGLPEVEAQTVEKAPEEVGITSHEREPPILTEYRYSGGVPEEA